MLIKILQKWEETHSTLESIKPIINNTEKSINSYDIHDDKIKKCNNIFKNQLCGFVQHQSTKKVADIDINYMEDINYHFNQAFGNKLQSSLIYEIIQILNETHNISQVRRFSCFFFIFCLLLSFFLCFFLTYFLFFFLSFLLSFFHSFFHFLFDSFLSFFPSYFLSFFRLYHTDKQ